MQHVQWYCKHTNHPSFLVAADERRAHWLIAGAPSSAMVKRLKYIGQCLEELSSLAITGTDDTNPAAAYTALSDQITLRAVVSPEAVRAGRRFQQQVLEELPGLMVRPGEALRHHLAWYSLITTHSVCHHVSSPVIQHVIGQSFFTNICSCQQWVMCPGIWLLQQLTAIV